MCASECDKCEYILRAVDAVRNEPHQSRKSMSNCALHSTRARKLFRVFEFCDGRGRVSFRVR
jgi:hypothetical protein